MAYRPRISGVFHDPANGDQINAQVPWEMLPLIPPTTNLTAQMVVTVNKVVSPPQTVTLAPAAPGIFAIQLSGGAVVGSGFGQAIAYGNSDGQIAAPVGAITGLATHPAKIGRPDHAGDPGDRFGGGGEHGRGWRRAVGPHLEHACDADRDGWRNCRPR